MYEFYMRKCLGRKMEGKASEEVTSLLAGGCRLVCWERVLLVLTCGLLMVRLLFVPRKWGVHGTESPPFHVCTVLHALQEVEEVLRAGLWWHRHVVPLLQRARVCGLCRRQATGSGGGGEFVRGKRSVRVEVMCSHGRLGGMRMSSLQAVMLLISTPQGEFQWKGPGQCATMVPPCSETEDRFLSLVCDIHANMEGIMM